MEILVTSKLREIAEAAAKIAGEKTFDEFCEMFVESVRAESEMQIKFIESFLNLSNELGAAYVAYAKALGRPPTTQTEKRQAFFDYILNKETEGVL